MRSGIDAAYKHLEGLHPLPEVPVLDVAEEDGVSEMTGGEEMMISQESARGSHGGSRQGDDVFDEIEASLRDLGAGLLGQGPGPSLADLTGVFARLCRSACARLIRVCAHQCGCLYACMCG